MITLFSLIFSSIGDETPEVDYDLIYSKGKETKAVVTDIDIQYNVTINEVHPTIIRYQYTENGKQVESKQKVLEVRKIEELEIGDEIAIKTLNGNSIIKNMEPYEFPLKLFSIIPVFIIIVGLFLILYSINNIRKDIYLYKFGNISKGRIISIMPKPGLPISNIGQGIVVHYEFETKNGQKIFAESFSTDFSIMGYMKKDDLIPIFISPKNDYDSCLVTKSDSYKNNWNISFD
ncbi:hypothetical protein [Flavobacterium sp.]|uniref:hypothetical protein n=2 Tax=Flavobacterium sp. TaxID=239 RepID=UPI004047ECEE